MRYFLMALQIMGIVTAWSSQALTDNKITLYEAADLAKQIGEVLGVQLEIELPQ